MVNGQRRKAKRARSQGSGPHHTLDLSSRGRPVNCNKVTGCNSGHVFPLPHQAKVHHVLVLSMRIAAKTRIPGQKPPKQFHSNMRLLQPQVCLCSCIFHSHAIRDTAIIEQALINALSNLVNQSSLNTCRGKPTIQWILRGSYAQPEPKEDVKRNIACHRCPPFAQGLLVEPPDIKVVC